MTALEFINFVKEAGSLAAPIFAILYWLERDERKDAQKELRIVTKESVQAMLEVKALVSQLVTIFGSTKSNKSH